MESYLYKVERHTLWRGFENDLNFANTSRSERRTKVCGVHKRVLILKKRPQIRGSSVFGAPGCPRSPHGHDRVPPQLNHSTTKIRNSNL